MEKINLAFLRTVVFFRRRAGVIVTRCSSGPLQLCTVRAFVDTGTDQSLQAISSRPGLVQCVAETGGAAEETRAM